MIAYIICFLAIAAAVGLPIYSAVKKNKSTPVLKAYSVGSTVSKSTTPSTSTTTSTTSASAAIYKSYGWMWPMMAAILGLVIVFWAVVPKLKTTAPAVSKTAAPKRELQKHTLRFPLDFFAGEKILHRGNVVTIRDGGYAIFRLSDLPWKKNAKYYVVFSVVRKTNGKHHFEIKEGRGGTFFLDHYASERVETCVFNFDSPGQAQFFRPGDNRFKISSPGDDIVIQYSYIHIEYWE